MKLIPGITEIVKIYCMPVDHPELPTVQNQITYVVIFMQVAEWSCFQQFTILFEISEHGFGTII